MHLPCHISQEQPYGPEHISRQAPVSLDLKSLCRVCESTGNYYEFHEPQGNFIQAVYLQLALRKPPRQHPKPYVSKVYHINPFTHTLFLEKQIYHCILNNSCCLLSLIFYMLTTVTGYQFIPVHAYESNVGGYLIFFTPLKSW